MATLVVEAGNPIMPYGDGKCTARLEFMKVESLDDVDLDDKITVVITGKVKSMRGPEKRKETEYPISEKDSKKKPRERTMEIPGCCEIEIESFHIENKGEWDSATEKMEKD